VRLPLAAAAEPAAPGAPAAEPVAPRGMRVMIPDDNRDAADSLCRVLALYGYEARAAYDGAQPSRCPSLSARTLRCSTSACRCATVTTSQGICARAAAAICG
jgi:hypothetical protein